MIGIVIVAHGGLAFEYLTAIEHVMGPQSQISTISFADSYDRASKTNEICAAIEAVDTGEGVAIIADLHGGSPANIAMAACARKNRRLLTGVNLPMLIKLAKCRDMELQKAIDAAREAGRKYITNPRIDL